MACGAGIGVPPLLRFPEVYRKAPETDTPSSAEHPVPPAKSRYLVRAPEKAVARPSAIKVPPEIFFCARRQPRLLRSFCARVPAKIAQELSLHRPKKAKVVPRKRICSDTWPRD